MLKADFHMHSNEDPMDGAFIRHNAFQLVDEAARQGYDVISLTLHERIYCPRELQQYAKERNILLIPGIEAAIEGKHVLVINPPVDAKVPYTFEEVNALRGQGAIAIAAHPYYHIETCLGEKLQQHIDCFDAIEYCHFYNMLINFNKKACEAAEKYKKPVVANSDTHFLFQYGTNYTRIDAEKSTTAVLEAIKKNKLEIATRPLTAYEFLRTIAWISYSLSHYKTIIKKRNWRKQHPIPLLL